MIWVLWKKIISRLPKLENRYFEKNKAQNRLLKIYVDLISII